MRFVSKLVTANACDREWSSYALNWVLRAINTVYALICDMHQLIIELIRSWTRHHQLISNFFQQKRHIPTSPIKAQGPFMCVSTYYWLEGHCPAASTVICVSAAAKTNQFHSFYTIFVVAIQVPVVRCFLPQRIAQIKKRNICCQVTFSHGFESYLPTAWAQYTNEITNATIYHYHWWWMHIAYRLYGWTGTGAFWFDFAFACFFSFQVLLPLNDGKRPTKIITMAFAKIALFFIFFDFRFIFSNDHYSLNSLFSTKHCPKCIRIHEIRPENCLNQQTIISHSNTRRKRLFSSGSDGDCCETQHQLNPQR